MERSGSRLRGRYGRFGMTYPEFCKSFIENMSYNSGEVDKVVNKVSNEDSSWLMIEVPNGTDMFEKMEVLLEKKVPCYTLEITSPKIAHGIAFPADNLKVISSILRIDFNTWQKHDTDVENVMLISPESFGVKPKPTSDHEVLQSTGRITRIGTSGFEAWSEILPVLESFADVMGTDICVSNPHVSDDKGKAIDRSKLNIVFYDSSDGTAKLKLENVFGIKLASGQKDAAVPSFHGAAIMDDNRVIVAEIVNDVIYVLFDLPHTVGNHADTLLTKILESYLVIKNRASDIVMFNENRKKYLYDHTKNAFVENCRDLVLLNIDSTNKALAKTEKTIRDYQQVIVETVRLQEGLIQKLKYLSGNDEQMKEWAGKEYDNLLAIPLVKCIKVNKTILTIYTKEINITHEGHNYNMGEYKIRIYTDGKEGTVKIFPMNSSKVHDSDSGYRYSHPHIKIDGYCCLGNISDGVAKLVGEREYGALANVMIQYLQSYYSGGAYAKIENWSRL